MSTSELETRFRKMLSDERVPGGWLGLVRRVPEGLVSMNFNEGLESL